MDTLYEGIREDSRRFHPVPQTGAQFKIRDFEQFIFGIFHLIFSDYS
jgi:hypothetical protein